MRKVKENVMYTLEEISRIVDRAIINLDLEGDPPQLYDPIKYFISMGEEDTAENGTYDIQPFSDKLTIRLLHRHCNWDISRLHPDS